MATISYDVCDRCGAKIDDHASKLATVCKPIVKWKICGVLFEDKRDFCKQCSKELDEFLSLKIVRY